MLEEMLSFGSSVQKDEQSEAELRLQRELEAASARFKLCGAWRIVG